MRRSMLATRGRAPAMRRLRRGMRVRWGNVGRAAVVLAILAAAVAWPRLAPAPPRLPGDEGIPLASPRPPKGPGARPAGRRAERRRAERRRAERRRAAQKRHAAKRQAEKRRAEKRRRAPGRAETGTPRTLRRSPVAAQPEPAPRATTTPAPPP